MCVQINFSVPLFRYSALSSIPKEVQVRLFNVLKSKLENCSLVWRGSASAAELLVPFIYLMSVVSCEM